MNFKKWILGAGALLLLWLVAFGAMRWMRSMEMTADKVAAYGLGRDLGAMGEEERRAFLKGLAERINRLEFEERQKLQMRRDLAPLAGEMTEEERLLLVEETLPEGFKQLMEALNKMTPEQRQRWVDRGLRGLRETQKRLAEKSEAVPEQKIDETVLQKFSRQGFQSYMENASSETKMDLAPLLEQIQIHLQGLRGP